jgi:uncharacterized protein (TIGR00251 family)
MSARLAVRVHPGARRAGLEGWTGDGALKVAVKSPPEGGRANRELEERIAEVLGVARGAVKVARGAGSRSKWIEVHGLDADEVKRRIEAHLGREGAADGG